MDKAHLPEALGPVRGQPHDADRLLLADAAAGAGLAGNPGGDPRGGRQDGVWMRPAAAARCSRWIRSCRTWTCTCPAGRKPSIRRAKRDPRRIIDAFRACGRPGLLGVKLGSEGALLSPAAGEYIEIPVVPAPGPVVDTTGAGDAYYAGLLTGLLRGMSVEQAGRLAAATGACCVTGYGATAGLRGFAETARLAGLDERDLRVRLQTKLRRANFGSD